MKIKIKLSGRKHKIQQEFINCEAKRIVIRAGRRSGKTVGVANLAVKRFLEGKRILYAAPTAGQVEMFWATVTNILAEPIRQKIFIKNETEKYIELPGTEQRIKAKTAWNADSLRGDYADVLILDEFQLMNEDI
jgi:CRISPR/Cas system-associated endonuclease/helicase Cas3